MKTIVLLITLFAMNTTPDNRLNEKWTLCSSQIVHDGSSNGQNSSIEVEFLSDGTFKYSGRHSNRWDSSAFGTYHYQKETGEIFVQVEFGGFDWLYRQATEGQPELYYSQHYCDYQLYFKVANRNDSTITVVEYINSYNEDIPKSSDTYDKSPVWMETNGQYNFIATDSTRMKGRGYTFSILTK